MKKDINIEKVLYPHKDKLVMDDEILTATIVDVELDEILCIFNNDGCVELNTDDYSYIVLSVNNLYKLIELIKKAEEEYNKL